MGWSQLEKPRGPQRPRSSTSRQFAGAKRARTQQTAGSDAVAAVSHHRWQQCATNFGGIRSGRQLRICSPETPHHTTQSPLTSTAKRSHVHPRRADESKEGLPRQVGRHRDRRSSESRGRGRPRQAGVLTLSGHRQGPEVRGRGAGQGNQQSLERSKGPLGEAAGRGEEAEADYQGRDEDGRSGPEVAGRCVGG